MDIFLRRPNEKGLKVDMNIFSWGPNGHLMITNEDQTLWFSLSGKVDDLAVMLRILADKAETLKGQTT